LSSKSSSNRNGPRIPVGRIAGHRGARGEVTVRGCGQAEAWLAIRRVWVARGPEGRFYDIEHCRAYRDRLVLKLKGVDDANGAARLRGYDVEVARRDAPELPEGVHYVAELLDMLVLDESGQELGRVAGIIETGGTDVLRVQQGVQVSGREEEAAEYLIPLAREYVRSIDAALRRIEVSMPRELRELNRPRRSSR
jgi:16S rRNA processing protein RimM